MLIELKTIGVEGEEEGEGEVEHRQHKPAEEIGFLGLVETSTAS